MGDCTAGVVILGFTTAVAFHIVASADDSKAGGTFVWVLLVWGIINVMLLEWTWDDVVEAGNPADVGFALESLGGFTKACGIPAVMAFLIGAGVGVLWKQIRSGQ